MLLPADRDVVARDPALSSLALVLDDQALGEWLSDRTGVTGSLRTTYLRYKPGTSCVAAAEITTPSGTRPCVFWGHDENSKVKLGKTLRHAGAEWMLGVDDALGLMATTPAGDRDLPALARLAGSEARRARLLGDALPGEGFTSPAQLRTLRYKPGRRWVGTLTDADGREAVLRLYPPARTQAALGGVTAWAGAPPRTPRLLGLVPRRGVLVVEYLPGTVLSDPEVTPAAFAAAGRALARLHARDDARLARDRVADEVGAVEAAGRYVVMLLPELAQPVRVLVTTLADRLRLVDEPTRPVHGDFAADQIVLGDDGQAAVIDLDAARWGSPAADLACACSGLVRDAVAGRLGTAAAARARELLLDGYADERPLPPAESLAVHEAAHLLRRAAEPFRLRWRPAWADATRALVTRAQQALVERGVPTGGGAR